MSLPEQHISKAPDKDATPDRRVYLHPAFLIVVIVAILVALVVTVISFNHRWNAAERMGAANAALRVELEKSRASLPLLEQEKITSQRLRTALAAQEAEAEMIAKIARESSTLEEKRKRAIDATRAITRRYIFTVPRDDKPAEEVVRELCEQYSKSSKGLACY